MVRAFPLLVVSSESWNLALMDIGFLVSVEQM